MSDLTPPQPTPPQGPDGANPVQSNPGQSNPGPAVPPPPYAGGPQTPPYAAPGVPYQPPAYPVQQPVQQYPGAAPVYGAPYGGAPYGYAPARRTNALAIVAMIASILGFIWVLPLIGGLTGAIMGHISLGQIKRTGEGGRGMALAGVIVGWIGVGLIVIGGIFIAIAIAASSANRYS